MALDLDQVKRIARLARLAVGDDEVAAVRDKLNDILAMIERMQAVDTTGVEPMSHPQDVVLRLRDDTVTESDQHERFQAIAPQVEAGLYLVPKVIE
jgi:aspartyl-tRNA(Asn)/glutamyl-tRNA(Gln) amidotransferase subunit C